MAIINSYPTITPTGEDLILIVDTSKTNNPTKTATVDSIASLASGATYDLTGQLDGASEYAINLTGSDGSLDKVKLLAGANITLTDSGSNSVTIDAAGASGMTSWNLTGDNATTSVVSNGDTVDIEGGTKITTAATLSDTLTINHDSTTRTDTTSTASPAAGGTFTVIDTVSQDATGHVEAVNVKTVTLPASGGGTTFSSQINFQEGNNIFNNFNAYSIKFYLTNKTVGSPDFGLSIDTPQSVTFSRQHAAETNNGGLPFNLFYKEYTPALDPSYDAGGSCSASAFAKCCILPMLEESVKDVVDNNGSWNQNGTFALLTTDMAALNSYRMPVSTKIDDNGASPGNGTVNIRIIPSNQSSPSSNDEIALPSTVSVYFRDTTDTSTTMNGPAFNLVWAGKDTVFAKFQNSGSAYTAGCDYVFSGNSGDTKRKYEFFFQDEINAYNRCSYLKVTDGRVVFEDLPTSDPQSKGVLWNDSGDLKISLG